MYLGAGNLREGLEFDVFVDEAIAEHIGVKIGLGGEVDDGAVRDRFQQFFFHEPVRN